MTLLHESAPVSSEPLAALPQDESYEPVSAISQEEIAAAAYALYVSRGCIDGHDLEDWLEAEALLKRRRDIEN